MRIDRSEALHSDKMKCVCTLCIINLSQVALLPCPASQITEVLLQILHCKHQHRSRHGVRMQMKAGMKLREDEAALSVHVSEQHDQEAEQAAGPGSGSATDTVKTLQDL
jgi:hypothetical protein